MFCLFAKALNYIFLFISLQNEAAKKYFLVSLIAYDLPMPLFGQ